MTPSTNTRKFIHVFTFGQAPSDDNSLNGSIQEIQSIALTRKQSTICYVQIPTPGPQPQQQLSDVNKETKEEILLTNQITQTETNLPNQDGNDYCLHPQFFNFPNEDNFSDLSFHDLAFNINDAYDSIFSDLIDLPDSRSSWKSTELTPPTPIQIPKDWIPIETRYTTPPPMSPPSTPPKTFKKRTVSKLWIDPAEMMEKIEPKLRAVPQNLPSIGPAQQKKRKTQTKNRTVQDDLDIETLKMTEDLIKQGCNLRRQATCQCQKVEKDSRAHCHGIFLSFVNEEKKTMFYCFECSHITSTKYKMTRHYRGVHVRKNKPMTKKRKYCNGQENNNLVLCSCK